MIKIIRKGAEASPPDAKDTDASKKRSPPKRAKYKRRVKKNSSTINTTGIESTLEKYHSKTDSELAEWIQPKDGKEDNFSHKLDLEQREARLVLMHRLLIRKVTAEEIRKQLNVSIAMFYKLKEQLEVKMRLDVSKVDVPYLIGDTLAFYDEVRSMALMVSSSTAVKDPRVKLNAMHVALKAEGDKNLFLSTCGVYSTPVIEHIVRGMVSTGQFSIVDGQSARMNEADEINFELATRLKAFAKEYVEEAVIISSVMGS